MTRLRSPEPSASFGEARPGDATTGATGAFDANHPPDAGLIDTCVHCGFCLPSCPTYVMWGEEMDSPRGRIYLMKAGLDGRTPMTPPFVSHFDACLGCMACVTSCPSGVQYAPLIEATRGQIERRHERSISDRLFRSAIFALFPYPARLRLALAPLALLQFVARPFRAAPQLGARGSPLDTSRGRRPSDQRSPERLALRARSAGLLERLRAMMTLAPTVTWRSLVAKVPERTPAVGARRLMVGLLTGCVQRIAFPRVTTRRFTSVGGGLRRRRAA